MKGYRPYLGLCPLAMLMPMLPLQAGIDKAFGFPGWPTRFEGHMLTRLPLSAREKRFYRDFPGRVARFSDGSRQIILRWVKRPTRKLHPAADCYKGLGFRIAPRTITIDKANIRWGAFMVDKPGDRMQVRERIHDQRGNSWTDVSSWYWAALFAPGNGPWWAVTVARRPGAGEG